MSACCWPRNIKDAAGATVSLVVSDYQRRHTLAVKGQDRSSVQHIKKSAEGKDELSKSGQNL